MAVATLNVKPLLSDGNLEMFSYMLQFFIRDLVYIADCTVYIGHGIAKGVPVSVAARCKA
jgi:hypothetical protein